MLRTLLVLLCSVLLTLTLRNSALAHPERINGLVLSVLEKQHAAVVRTSQRTTLYKLSPRVDVTTLHAGDKIVGLIDADKTPLVIDEIKILPADAPKSIIRNVIPLETGDEMPATQFIDQRGHAFSFADFHGKSVVLAFIYTRCRDVRECPLISSHMAVLQKRFANGPYHLVEMTLDPSYDRPGVLTQYGKLYGADPSKWTLATGDPETVLDFDARFGIDPFADPHLGLIHTERTVLIDPEGKIIDFMDQAAWNPSDVAGRLESSLNKPTGWLATADFYLSKATVAICGNGAAGFSGLEDLAIIIAILGSVALVLQRVARFFLVH